MEEEFGFSEPWSLELGLFCYGVCILGVKLDRPKVISEQPRSKTQEIHRFLRIRVLERLQAHPRCSPAYVEYTIEHPYCDFLVSAL